MTEKLIEQYTYMLKVGDIAGCLELRLKHMDDRELNQRLITTENVHYKWVRLYIEEIQLLRMHVTALRNIVDGYEVPNKNLVRQGQKQLKNVIALKKQLGEIDIPNLKDYE